ncbi:MAG: Wzz/FepE/Etk N-terminal domain-containing protein, partial [Lentisphaerota bacterium]
MAESQEATLHFLDYWRVIKSRKEIVLAVTLLIVITGTAYTFMLPKRYSASVQMLVREDSMNVDVFERQMIQGYNPFFLKTQEKILTSAPLLYQVIDNLNLTQVWGEQQNEDRTPLSKEDSLEKLAGSIAVEQDRDTSIINITVTDEDREFSARIANEIANVYRDMRLSVKRQEIKHAIDVLNQELQKQQEKVDQAETELQAVREKMGVSMIGQGQQGFRIDKIRLQQLEADRIGARVEMLVRKARLEQLESLEGTELMNASSYMVQDQTLASIRQQLIDSEVSLRLLLENVGVNHPGARRLTAAVDELKKKLTDALVGLKAGLKADYAVARAKYEALDAELQSAKQSDIQDESKKFLPYDRAERNVLVQRDILTALRARISQQGIEIEVPRTPAEIVEPAEAPNRPSSPIVVINILLSIILGLGAGLGLAYFIEYLDTSVKTVDDVEQFLSLPVLGVIPQKVRPLVQEGADSPHAEPYR